MVVVRHECVLQRMSARVPGPERGMVGWLGEKENHRTAGKR
jgi:hypothetical protein